MPHCWLAEEHVAGSREIGLSCFAFMIPLPEHGSPQPHGLKCAKYTYTFNARVSYNYEDIFIQRYKSTRTGWHNRVNAFEGIAGMCSIRCNTMQGSS
eukprot:6213730-Pleurochrysis_carterae.AAC.5